MALPFDDDKILLTNELNAHANDYQVDLENALKSARPRTPICEQVSTIKPDLVQELIIGCELKKHGQDSCPDFEHLGPQRKIPKIGRKEDEFEQPSVWLSMRVYLCNIILVLLGYFRDLLRALSIEKNRMAADDERMKVGPFGSLWLFKILKIFLTFIISLCLVFDLD